MWEINKPIPVKLIVGILAADTESLSNAQKSLISLFGPPDLTSEIWPFTQTDYYRAETGPNILRQFLSFQNLIDPGDLAQVKIQTNHLEQQLAQSLQNPLPRKA